jgi:hypothetical protein
VLLDSATPFIWLPQNMSDSIAKSLNADWDAASALYTLRNDTHKTWIEKGLQIFFELQAFKSTIRTSSSVAEMLPVTLRDNEGSSDGMKSYLPIRPLPQNDTQAVFGRAFFHAACILTNYETMQFQLTARSQHAETQTRPGKFVPVLSLKNTNSSSTIESPVKHPKSDVHRLVIEIVLGVLFLCAIVFLFFWGRNRRRGKQNKDKLFEMGGSRIHELGSRTPELPPVEGTTISEMDGTTITGSDISPQTAVVSPAQRQQQRHGVSTTSNSGHL